MERSILSTNRRKTRLISIADLKQIRTPEGTETHRPIPHHEVVEGVMSALTSRNIAIHGMELAVSMNEQKCFGIIELENGMTGLRFAMGLRNSHDMSMCLGLTVGYRVFVCDNMGFFGDFMPIEKKHTKGIDLQRVISMGVDVMQRSFGPMTDSVELQRATSLSDERARRIIYRVFVQSEIEIPKYLGKRVHELYFNPEYDEFVPRTAWSLSNAFTSAFKILEPVAQYRATGKFGEFFEKNFAR